MIFIDIETKTLNIFMNYYHKPAFCKYAEETAKEFNIDDSHGPPHLAAVAKNCAAILREFADVSIINGLSKSEENDLICDAAFVHDLVDSKYVKESKGIKKLTAFLREESYSDHKINIIIYIITNMSFSKRRRRQSLNLEMVEEGPYALATKIVIDADQLDAYDPLRCLDYQKNHKWLNHPDRDQLSMRWVKTIMIKRVLLYLDVYMYTAVAKQIATPLHQELLKYVEALPNDLEMFEY